MAEKQVITKSTGYYSINGIPHVISEGLQLSFSEEKICVEYSKEDFMEHFSYYYTEGHTENFMLTHINTVK